MLTQYAHVLPAVLILRSAEEWVSGLSKMVGKVLPAAIIFVRVKHWYGTSM